MKFWGRFITLHPSNRLPAPASWVKTFCFQWIVNLKLWFSLTITLTRVASFAWVCTQAIGVLPSLKNGVPMTGVKLKKSNVMVTSHYIAWVLDPGHTNMPSSHNIYHIHPLSTPALISTSFFTAPSLLCPILFHRAVISVQNTGKKEERGEKWPSLVYAK